ncbi:MAG: multiheme c-type cytochrome [Gemmataceae bacterium]
MTRRVWFGAAVLFAVAAGGLLPAQPPAAAPPKSGPSFIKDTAFETTCLKCHERPTDRDVTGGRNKFVLFHESTYWEQYDLHRKAFAALDSPLGRAISTRLYRGDAKAAAAQPACLVCHSTDTQPHAALSETAAERFSTTFGVNCQACHGPAQEWWPKHIEDAVWRMTRPPDKAKLGQTDLRDPAVRATTCVECHIGSAEKGRFVTHAMYAAGHPPLPPFELATFSRDEPRHWRPAAAVDFTGGARDEIAKQLKAPGKLKELFHYRAGEVEAARLVAVGAVTALRESAKLVGFGPDKSGGMLDFAHFNCAACHHELRVNGDRQKSGFPGTPGRPVPQTWPVWATRAVLRHAAAALPETAAVRDEFEKAYREFRTVFDKAPFGDKPEAVAKAEALAVVCGEVLKALDGIEYTPAAARSLVAALGAEANDLSRRDYLDPDGATQLARSATVITDELTTPPKPTPPGPQLDKPAPPPTFPNSPLRELHAAVGLTVREAEKNPLLQERGTYTDRAKRAAKYNSGDFRKLFDALTRP